MPIIRSAIKRARQSEARRLRRQPVKTQMKTMMRTLTTAAKSGRAEEALKLLPSVQKAIDMAAKRNILHWKNAARKKSLMQRMVTAAVKGKA